MVEINAEWNNGRDSLKSPPLISGQSYPCRICGGDSRLIRTFFRRAEEVVYLNSCQDCRCEFLFPQPSDEWLAEEYSGYFQKRSSFVSRAKVPYFSDLLNRSGFDFSAAKVADIGSGEGDFVRALNQHWPTAEIHAVESNAEAKAYYSDLHCEFHCDSVEDWALRDKQPEYDYIFLLDLLEHLRNPVDVVTNLTKRCLKPGGKIIATFPNVDVGSRSLFGRWWAQYKIEHLFYFSEKSIRELERKASLSRVSCRPFSKKLPAEYLLKVGSGFGPPMSQKFVRLIDKITPTHLRKFSIALPLGESLWIALKN